MYWKRLGCLFTMVGCCFACVMLPSSGLVCTERQKHYNTLVKNLHSRNKTFDQIITTADTKSASHFLQNKTHIDLQNTEHACLH